jgi:hypothetical protein
MLIPFRRFVGPFMLLVLSGVLAGRSQFYGLSQFQQFLLELLVCASLPVCWYYTLEFTKSADNSFSSVKQSFFSRGYLHSYFWGLPGSITEFHLRFLRPH